MVVYDPIKFKIGLAAALCSKARTFNKGVVLEVMKITSNTYASSTTYQDEEFILLDIYPKSGGTVSVTYGGLTKTITDTSGAEDPNAQQVFFGTFNGVSDSVITPESGILRINGDYKSFAVSTFNIADKDTATCGCITGVVEFGDLTKIADRTFYECAGLTSINIPTSITSIGEYAFYGCTGLPSIYIPASITSISICAFKACEQLKITVSEENKLYSSEAGALFDRDKTVIYAYPSVNGSYIIPDSVLSIEEYAFCGCIALSSVSIPDNIISIGAHAFDGCTALTYANIPNSLTNIGEYAFYDCTALANISIPSSITNIEAYTFYNCDTLSSINIPTSVTNIGDRAFYDCDALTYISIPSGVSSIGTYAICACGALAGVAFENTSGWYVTKTENGDISTGTTVDVTNVENNVVLLNETYENYYWYRT